MTQPQPFAAQDYQAPSRRIRSQVARMLQPLFGWLGYDVLPRHFYSPIPRPRELPSRFWSEPSAMLGVAFDTTAQLAYLERELVAHMHGFRPPRASSGDPKEYFLDNGLFQAVDAEVLYAMVRRHRPRRIVELGAGFSTLVIASACSANGRDGEAPQFVSYDPYAAAPKDGELPGLMRLELQSAETVPLSVFESLQPDDILFIDTSHTVKVGGDVTHLVLEALPRVGPGVLVHFHDVFLPWHYPREWVEHNGWYWAEQYLLQAFLSCNQRFETLFAAYAVAREHPDALRAAIPSFRPEIAPLSLWLRRTG